MLITSGHIFLKNFSKIYKDESGHHRCDHLALVADHLDLREPEIPHRDLIRRGRRHAESIQKLGGYQRQSEDDTRGSVWFPSSL